jgi:hypothetical protein
MKKLMLIVALVGLVTLSAAAATYPPWDVNQDSCVDIYDCILIASHFGTNSTDANWLTVYNEDGSVKVLGGEACDINPVTDDKGNFIGYGDGMVDVYDAITMANHYGESYK